MSVIDKLSTILEKVPVVYEAGKTSQYNEFWERYQEGGNRKRYINAFSYEGWNDDNYNPLYPIHPTNKYGIQAAFYWNMDITDTKVDIIIDSGSIYNAFANCAALQRIPYIELNGCTDFKNAFANCSALEYIRIGGEIDKSVDFSTCPLDLESAISVIEHLKNFRDIEEFAYTITFSDSTWALLDADGSKDHGYVEGTWRDLLTYMCWNF